MTTPQDTKPGLLARYGLDWIDLSGLTALALIGAGAWLTWDLGVALLVVGGLLAAVVARLVFPREAKPADPSNTRRS